jgi:thiol-disulfide isomerase/thioredoxin
MTPEKKSLVPALTLAAVLIGLFIVSLLHAPTPTGLDVRGIQQFSARPVTDASFLRDDGKATVPSDFKGTVTLLHFWATWCGPCVEELQSLNNLQRELGENIMIIPISVDAKPLPYIKEFYTKHRVGLPLYRDPSMKAMRALTNAPALPFTLIINTEGKQVGSVRGAIDWDRDDVREMLQRVMLRHNEAS